MAPNKVAIFGLIATLAVAGAVAAAIILAGNTNTKTTKDQTNNISTSQKAIQDLCQSTYYQQTCTETLSNATNSSDPQTLIQTIFEIAIDHLNNTIRQSGALQQISNDPKTAQAYKTCTKVLDDSIQDLRKSIQRTETFDFFDFSIFIDDIKTWLTGALTYQETCLDSFEDTKGDHAETMRQLLKLSRELTTNGLAIANQIHKLFLPNLLAPPVAPTKRQLADRKPLSPRGDSNYYRKLLQMGSNGKYDTPNVVVAKDGSGKYKTVTEALKEVPERSNETFVIHVKEGVYEEYVEITSGMWSVVLVGDGPTKTRITGKKSYGGDGLGTYFTATVGIDGDNFIGKDIGFENTAGAIGYQAVALRVSADKAIFYNCHIDGYQDTLYAHNHRQYYRDCTISGTIDFIFGNARALIQNCTLLVRKPLDNQACVVTANGRTLSNETSAFVIHGSRVVAAPEYPVDDKRIQSFLGRPWKEYSKTIFMASEIEGFISPEGWSPWDNTADHLDTCWYAEVGNRGPGADLTNRVKWPGIKNITMAEAAQFAPTMYMDSGHWIEGKGIPFDSVLEMVIKN
ncbi:hypothetical protein ACP275_07G011000 [Erythranthe tilingii]